MWTLISTTLEFVDVFYPGSVLASAVCVMPHPVDVRISQGLHMLSYPSAMRERTSLFHEYGCSHPIESVSSSIHKVLDILRFLYPYVIG